MKEIPLPHGKVALVDDDVYDYLMQWKWHVKSNYAVRSETTSPGKQMCVYMHRVIMQASDDMEVDHIRSRETLNNQRKNLRVCSHAENGRNRTKGSNNTSGFKGVSFRKDITKWQAAIRLNGTDIYLGCFVTPEEAAKAYDAKALELFGEFAKLNFPIEA